MAALPLSQTVDASGLERSWRSSILAILTSTVVQGLVITAMIVVPLLVAEAMPEPVSQLTLPPVVPIAVAPPVARGPEPPDERRARAPGDTFDFDVDALVPPIEIADGIAESDAYFSAGDPVGVVGGLSPSLGGAPPPPEPAPEPEADPEPIWIIGDVRPPRKIVHVDPVYPPLARAAQVQGTVELRAIIGTDGMVSDVVVVRSVPLLDRAAIEAVRQWRYQPTIQNGRAVPVIMTVAVEFLLRR